MAAQWQAGRRVLVKYPTENLWHTRLLCAHVAESEWVSLTPDGDLYEEVLEPQVNLDIEEVIELGVRGGLPRRVPGNSVYAFGAPLTAAEKRQALCRGEAYANQLRQSRQPVAAPVLPRAHTPL